MNSENKVTIKTSFEIPQASFDFLMSLVPKQQLEFRDYIFYSLEEYLEVNCSKPEDVEKWTNHFKSRNPCDPEVLQPLLDKNLLQDVPDAWHTTYELSDFGIRVIAENKVS